MEKIGNGKLIWFFAGPAEKTLRAWVGSDYEQVLKLNCTLCNELCDLGSSRICTHLLFDLCPLSGARFDGCFARGALAGQQSTYRGKESPLSLDSTHSLVWLERGERASGMKRLWYTCTLVFLLGWSSFEEIALHWFHVKIRQHKMNKPRSLLQILFGESVGTAVFHSLLNYRWDFVPMILRGLRHILNIYCYNTS